MHSSMEECSINAQKIKAMKNHKRVRFLCNSTLHSLTSITAACLFISYPFWIHSVKQLLSPLSKINVVSFFSQLDAKCLFVVANLIILILVRECKMARPSSSYPDIYDEYIARSRSTCPKVNSAKGKRRGNIKHVYNEEKKREMRVCNSSVHHKQKKIELRVCKSEAWDERERVVREKTKGESMEGMPREELNKRVEAFIARVNKQRLLEAKLDDHSRG